nr:hypothetical protein [Geodermatophilus ruber]
MVTERRYRGRCGASADDVVELASEIPVLVVREPAGRGRRHGA